MKKSSKELLFERMEYLNPDFNRRLNENLNDKEQNIINDILSTNEGIGDWWNKFVQYGKKGLLTTAIIFAIASSAQAQQQNKTADVIKTGIELTQNQNTEVNKVLHNFVIGMAIIAGEDDMEKGRIDNAKLKSEVIKFHMERRNGNTSNTLSPQAKQYEDMLWDIFEKTYKNNLDYAFQQFVKTGESIKSYNSQTTGW
jgi:hypothetical protein